MPALRLEHDDGIAIVTIDLPGESVNKVTAALRTEFAELFGRIENAAARRYEEAFGFRYCVFVNGRSRPARVPELVAGVTRDAASGRERAVHSGSRALLARQSRPGVGPGPA